MNKSQSEIDSRSVVTNDFVTSLIEFTIHVFTAARHKLCHQRL